MMQTILAHYETGNGLEPINLFTVLYMLRKHQNATVRLLCDHHAGFVQAQDKEINVVSWGGAYEKSQVEAYNIPFSKETGIKVNMMAADNPATPLKAQIEAGNITGDVFDIEVSDAIRLCDEGALVEINPDDLPPPRQPAVTLWGIAALA